MLRRKVENDTITLFNPRNEFVLSMQAETDEDIIMISLKGDFVSDSANDFFDEVMAFVSLGKDIVLDFTDVGYFSTSCIHRTLHIQKAIDLNSGGEFVLCNMSEKVYSDFKEIGLTELLFIDNSR